MSPVVPHQNDRAPISEDESQVLSRKIVSFSSVPCLPHSSLFVDGALVFNSVKCSHFPISFVRADALLAYLIWAKGLLGAWYCNQKNDTKLFTTM